jgi:hypothetical protein
MNQLGQAGAQTVKQTRYAPMHCNRWFTGLWTQRNPLRDAATPYLYEKFYSGSRIESLIGGENVECTTRLTIARRPGNSVYNSETFPTINTFYEFKTFTTSAESIQVIADTATNVYNATGPNTKTSILSKSAGAGQTHFQSVGNILYMGDGVDQQKYLQSGNTWVTQNWGIAISAVSGTGSQGPEDAGSGANGGGTGAAWTNPGSVSTSGSTVGATANSQTLLATDFGFSVSTSDTIAGIVFFANIQIATAVTGTVVLQVQLLGNGVPIGNVKTYTPTNSSYNPVTLGSASDLWGNSWTPTAINNTNFGVQIYVQNNSAGNGYICGVNTLVLTTYYNGSGPTVTPTGTGTFSATSGFGYLYCYGNSLSGAVSNPTAAQNTGVFTDKSYVAVGVTASSDSQVNQIRVFRTTDGGATYFELPTSPYPNTTATIQDSAPSSTLIITNEAPVGLENSPPPAGLINLTYHLETIFGSVANTVYYSTGPYTVLGNPNEAWNPLNFFTFPSYVTRLVPTASGLLVFTLSDLYIIAGSNTESSPLASFPYLLGLGLQSYNALDIQGTTIYLMSNEQQVLSFEPGSGCSEIGFPIGDLLEATFSPAETYVTWHSASSSDKGLYVADGSTGWYRLNPTPSPETGASWSPKANIVGGCGAVQSIEVSPGIHKLLVGPVTSGPILQRDTTTNEDNGSTYPANFTIGSIVLCLPGQRSEVSFVTTESVKVGTELTLGVLLDEISGTFETLSNSSSVSDPPGFAPSQSLYATRRYFSSAAQPAWCRHLQFQITWPSENQPNELLTYTLFGAYHQEM